MRITNNKYQMSNIKYQGGCTTLYLLAEKFTFVLFSIKADIKLIEISISRKQR